MSPLKNPPKHDDASCGHSDEHDADDEPAPEDTEKTLAELVAADVIEAAADAGDDPLLDAYDDVLALATRLKGEIERRGQVAERFVVANPASYKGPDKDSFLAHKQAQALVFTSYTDADRFVSKSRPGGTVLAVLPAGDARERRGAELAAGLAEELTDLRADLEQAKERADELRASRDAGDEVNAELIGQLAHLRDDMTKQVEERTTKEREELKKARDVVYLNSLRKEVEAAREVQKRLLMIEMDPKSAELNVKILKESQLASQLEAVQRTALGQPCPEEGAFNWSRSAAAVDDLWAKEHAARQKIEAGILELKKLDAGGSNAAMVVRAARAVLEAKPK